MNFLKKLQQTGNIDQRLQLVNPGSEKVSIRKHCDLLSINRSKLYYKPAAEKPENVQMMNIMDRAPDGSPDRRGGFDGSSPDYPGSACRSEANPPAVEAHGPPGRSAAGRMGSNRDGKSSSSRICFGVLLSPVQTRYGVLTLRMFR